MLRRSFVTSFLALLTLAVAFPTVATADPIVTSAYRRVLGQINVPVDDTFTDELIESSATSGLFAANIQDVAVQDDASAEYAVDLTTFLSPFFIEGTASLSSAIVPQAQVSSDAYVYATFTLDGSYDYSLSGLLSASLLGPYYSSYSSVQLYSYSSGYLDYAQTLGGTVPFSFLGTLAAGDYSLLAYGYSSHCCDALQGGNADFDFEFSLTPAASVPDSGETFIMFLLGSALLAAFAFQQRQRTRQ